MQDTNNNAVTLTYPRAGVAQLTLNRPDKRNAFHAGIIRTLTEHLEAVADDGQVRVLVLAAAGKHFCAGADLGWMRDTAAMSEADNRDDARALARLMTTLDTLAKPTIARVQGAAFGGALGLICCCDMAIAADDALFCLSEVRLGLAPATIGPFVVRAMGHRQARRYLLSAERFGAQDAQRLGVVHESVPLARLDERVEEQINALLDAGPEALGACKHLLLDLENAAASDQIHEQTAELIARLRTGAEGQEGLTAFFEKREPQWRIRPEESS